MAQRIKNILAVIVFLLLFPYFWLSFRQQMQIRDERKQQSMTERAAEAAQEKEQPAEAEAAQEKEQPAEAEAAQEKEQPAEAEAAQEKEQPAEAEAAQEKEQPAEAEAAQKEKEQKIVVSEKSAGSDKIAAAKNEQETMLAIMQVLADLPQCEAYFVKWSDEGSKKNMPVEIFMVGALAASIDVDYEEEALKAQAVVLRSTLCQAYEKKSMQDALISQLKGSSQGEHCIYLDETNGKYMSDEAMQKAWGKHYEERLKKCLFAVLDTQGLYACYNGKAINGCYHGMSCGHTRDGEELSDSGEYAYLKAADCPDSLSALDYLQKKIVSAKSVGELSDVVRSESGYVISLKQDGKIVSGEELRSQLYLASSCFSWEQKNGRYVFTTKGNGHGFGMDQYYANVLAGQGMDYFAILKYFYADITLERME